MIKPAAIRNAKESLGLGNDHVALSENSIDYNWLLYVNMVRVAFR